MTGTSTNGQTLGKRHTQPRVTVSPKTTRFVSVVLGAGGGLREDNLSAYLLAPADSQDFIALDAGTLLAGLRRAFCKNSFGAVTVPPESDLSPEGWFLRHRIKAYLITHAHLDHVAGLVMNSPEDDKKAIFGLPCTINYLRDYLFNGKIWPNFGNEGEDALHKYHYIRAQPGHTYTVANTSMSIEPFVLDHIPNCPSTAYLIHSKDAYVLYFGDTGPDALTATHCLQTIWTRVAPLIRDKKLHGIFLESSHPNDHPDHLLFGHLTPTWVMDELHRLAAVVDPAKPRQALRDLSVVVTHIKPSLERNAAPQKNIAQQLQEMNDIGVRFVIPKCGQRIAF